jgi:thymidylate synthase ThyX
MTLSAKIIKDSLAPDGCRLTTFVLRYHRMVHAELMTHRAFSRNSSSSRAIPVKRMIEWVKEDPAVPVEWGKNQSGMQARELLSPEDAAKAELVWLEARDLMITKTQELIDLNVHKQIANRLLEPWHHISVIVTATSYANWFGLRYHPDAQPEIRDLAKLMAVAYLESNPRQVVYGQWHLPFVTIHELATLSVEEQIKLSVARCARVSFNNHDGTASDPVKDVELHDKLAVQNPLHASPAEHQGTPISSGEDRALCGNFGRSWKQYRKTLPNECISELPWVKNPELLKELRAVV